MRFLFAFRHAVELGVVALEKLLHNITAEELHLLQKLSLSDS